MQTGEVAGVSRCALPTPGKHFRMSCSYLRVYVTPHVKETPNRGVASQAGALLLPFQPSESVCQEHKECVRHQIFMRFCASPICHCTGISSCVLYHSFIDVFLQVKKKKMMMMMVLTTTPLLCLSSTIWKFGKEADMASSRH
jgi:hypothetical protein